jgi:hypothetical protein
MIRTAKELSPDQRMAVESLLGRSVSEDERIVFGTLDAPPEWLKRSWDDAKRRGLDALSQDDIQAEIDAYRRLRQ